MSYECPVMLIFACFVDECPRDQNGSYSGNFFSPDYPINYLNKEICTWGITVPGDYRILVTFDEFNTQRNSDFLNIYDGASNSSDMLAILSGDLSGSTYGSSGSSLWFEFTTDGSITARGFHATYTVTQQSSTYRLDFHFVPWHLLILFSSSSRSHIPAFVRGLLCLLNKMIAVVGKLNHSFTRWCIYSSIDVLTYIVTHANLFVVLCIFIDYLVTFLPYFATIMPCDTWVHNDISARKKEASYFVVSVDILVIFQVYSALLILPLSFIEIDDKITDPSFYCPCSWVELYHNWPSCRCSATDNMALIHNGLGRGRMAF